MKERGLVRHMWIPLLAFLTLVVYIPVLSSGFGLWYKIEGTPLDEPLVKDPTGIVGIWAGEKLLDDTHYRPVAFSVYWLAFQLWGNAEIGHLLLALGLHFACALYGGIIMRALRIPGAALATVLFALHPIAVQSVAWIVNIKVLLSSLFYLAACYGAILFRKKQKTWIGCLVLFLLVLACLSKSSAVSFPGILVLYGIFAWVRPTLREWILLGACSVAVVAVGVTDYFFVSGHDDIGASGGFSIADRAVLTGVSFMKYIKNAIVPYPLMINYPFALSVADILIATAVGILGVTLLICRRTGEVKVLLVLLLGFALSLSPHWVVLTDTWRATPVHDRYQYVGTLLFWCAFAAILARGMESHVKSWRFVSLAGFMVCCVCFFVLTWRQGQLYASDTRIYELELQHNPQNRMSRLDLINPYIKLKQWDKVQTVSAQLLNMREWKDRRSLDRLNIYQILLQSCLENRRQADAMNTLRTARQEYELTKLLPPSKMILFATIALEHPSTEVRDSLLGQSLVSALRTQTHRLSEVLLWRFHLLDAADQASRGEFELAVEMLLQAQERFEGSSVWSDTSRRELAERMAHYRRRTLYRFELP